MLDPIRPYCVADVGNRLNFLYRIIVFYYRYIHYCRIFRVVSAGIYCHAAIFEYSTRRICWLVVICCLVSTWIDFCFHGCFGGSLGNLLSGYRTIRIDGTPMSWRQAFLISCCILSLTLMVVIPGPIVARIFGQGSEWVSLLLLFLAVFSRPMLALLPIRTSMGSPRDVGVAPTRTALVRGPMTVGVG